jgi:hypothetical protein
MRIKIGISIIGRKMELLRINGLEGIIIGVVKWGVVRLSSNKDRNKYKGKKKEKRK